MRATTLAALGAAAVLGGSAVTVTTHASRAHGASAHAASAAGAGGRSSASGGTGGSSTGGTGVACGGLDLFIAVTQLPLHANAANNLGGGQLQLGNGLGGLDNLFAPVGASSGGSQTSTQGVTTLSGSSGASDSGDTGNAACGSAGGAGTGARGGTARGGRGGSGGTATARGGAAHAKSNG